MRLRSDIQYKLWAYVIMPNHVHILLWPQKANSKMATILQSIKGKTSTFYKKYLIEVNPSLYKSFLVNNYGREIFKFWQSGGGFDRNLWNGKAIHSAISYIENNPVRAGLVLQSDEWKWSSAYARKYGKGLVPDEYKIPILLK